MSKSNIDMKAEKASVYKIFVAISLLALVLCTSSCYTNNEEELYPQAVACIDTNISFSKNIYPILSNNCLGCHSISKNATSGGNISLEGYTKVKEAVDSEILLPSIKHLPNFSPMPKGSSKLSDCNIQLIEKWISEGAKDN